MESRSRGRGARRKNQLISSSRCARIKYLIYSFPSHAPIPPCPPLSLSRASFADPIRLAVLFSIKLYLFPFSSLLVTATGARTGRDATDESLISVSISPIKRETQNKNTALNSSQERNFLNKLNERARDESVLIKLSPNKRII